MDDATAEWYVRNYGDDPTNRITVGVAELKPDDIVLDVGCGSGTAVREAAARLPRGRAVGIDLSPAMVRIASEKSAPCGGLSRIDYLQGEAAHLPLGDATVAVAWAINSLHHWDDPLQGLFESRRVLWPGGRFFVTEEQVDGSRFGHSDGPLSDAGFVMRTLEEMGFVGVEISEHAEDRQKILIISCWRGED